MATSNEAYRQILWLNIHWEDRERKDLKGIEPLERILEKLNIQNIRAPLPNDATEALRTVDWLLREALQVCKEPSDLLVIYYRGHGGIDPSGGLRWASKSQDTHIYWSRDKMNLALDTDANVLFIMHCCHVGGAAPAAPVGDVLQGAKELVAACAANKTTKGRGLALVIAEGIEAAADAGEPITVAELHERSKHDNRLKAGPVFKILGAHSNAQIQLGQQPYGGRALRPSCHPGRPRLKTPAP